MRMENAFHLCKAVGFDLLDLIDNSKFGRIAIAPKKLIASGQKDNPVLGSAHTKLFASYIDLKLKDFVGRDHVFKAFETFMAQENRGYFTLIADPGEGKSAIAAHYVRHNPCFFYFNRRNKNLVTPEQFIECLCKQLIEAGNMQIAEWPSDATTHGFFLADLLEDYVRKHKKVVIVVDALDEVKHNSRSTLLHLPEEELPNGVYFFLTMRRDDQLMRRLPKQVSIVRHDLANYRSQCEDDVRAYLEAFLDDRDEGAKRKKKLADQSKSKTLEESKAILIRNSNRNFMYLTLVLPEIMNGRYQNFQIDELPDGLFAYYQDHWDHMLDIMHQVNMPLDTLRIVYHISKSKVALPGKAIADRANKPILDVEFIILNWMQFFDPEAMYEQRFYAFYHESYRDHLEKNEIVKSAGNIDIQEINQEKADYLLGDIKL